MIVQGIYQAAPITVTDGTPVTLLVDDQGRLIVTISGGGGGSTDVNVAEWGGVATTLGQKVMASSVPVVLASNQSSVPVNLSNIAAEADNATIAQSATANALKVNSRLYGLNGTNWIRLGCDTAGNIFVRNAFVEVTPANNQANSVSVAAAARQMVWDGATWDLGLGGVITAQTGAQGWQNVLGGASFTTAAPTLTPGQVIAQQGDSRGNRLVKQGLGDISARDSAMRRLFVDTVSTGVNTVAGQLFAFCAQNLQATPLWFQIFNKASGPVLGDIPDYAFLLGNISPPFFLDQAFFGQAGAHFPVGIAFGWSTTAATFTAASVVVGNPIVVVMQTAN